MIYKLRNGYSILTAQVGPKTEFTTKNPEGEIISTLCVSGREAHDLKHGLCLAVRLAAV